MAPKAMLLFEDFLTDNDARFVKLAAHMGIGCAAVPLKELVHGTDFNKRYGKAACAVVDADSLCKAAERHGIRRIKSALDKHVAFLLLYNLRPSGRLEVLVRTLSDQAIPAIGSFEKATTAYEVGGEAKNITKQFSGLTFGPIDPANDFCFTLDRKAGNAASLISIEGKPLFAMVEKEGRAVFYLATGEIVNIDDEHAELHTASLFSRTVPAMMFLKHVFQNACWHAKDVHANFIIDDPTLKNSYGFLDYQKLLAACGQTGCASTIAFIPYNYKKTNNATAALFKTRGDVFSLCVHGCDHTEAEFASTDGNSLDWKVRTATKKMEAHRRNHGLNYAPLMIFPQGLFSVEAMGALKKHGYWAAVNSHLVPRNPGPVRLKLSDLLDPAVMAYEDFPLFARLYPREIADFAFFAFLGKPLFIVEHHDYFKKGYADFKAFTGAVNALSGRVRWASLGNAVRSSYLVREGADGTTYCKMFSNSIVISNASARGRKYVVLKKESQAGTVEKVTVNGSEKRFTPRDGMLQVEVFVGPHAGAVVDIVYRTPPCPERKQEPVTAPLRVTARRLVSEFRDNYLSRSDFLLSGFNRIKRLHRRIATMK